MSYTPIWHEAPPSHRHPANQRNAMRRIPRMYFLRSVSYYMYYVQCDMYNDNNNSNEVDQEVSVWRLLIHISVVKSIIICLGVYQFQTGRVRARKEDDLRE
jgi:hypothetical protein